MDGLTSKYPAAMVDTSRWWLANGSSPRSRPTVTLDADPAVLDAWTERLVPATRRARRGASQVVAALAAEQVLDL